MRSCKNEPIIVDPPCIFKTVTATNQIMWAFIGLLLTIGGTFLDAYITTSPLNWNDSGLQTFFLGITYQIGAVLLTGCLGGKNAGAISQIAYLLLGLTWLPVFAQGGGFDYIKQPYFGYVLGFIPGRDSFNDYDFANYYGNFPRCASVATVRLAPSSLRTWGDALGNYFPSFTPRRNFWDCWGNNVRSREGNG